MKISLEDLEPIRKSYEAGRLRIIVGAGASMAAGLPSWAELNRRLIALFFNASVSDSEQLFGSYSALELDQIAHEFTDAFSKDAVIDLLKQRMADSTEDFEALLHRALYDGIQKFQIQPLHYELAAMLEERTEKSANSLLYTFNYDDILETAVEHFGSNATPIVDESEPESKGIVHLHGFLPLNADSGRPEAQGTIVLSERDYFDSDGAIADTRLSELFNDPESDVLLIGMSMSDPRIRRLLHERVKASKSHSGKVWALLTRRQPSSDDDIAKRRARLMAAAHVRPYWESWDVNVLDLPNHEALPTALRLIRQGRDVGQWLEMGRDFLKENQVYETLYDEGKQVRVQLTLLQLHDLLRDRFEVDSDELFTISFFVPGQEDPSFVEPCFRFGPRQRKHIGPNSWRSYPVDRAEISPLSPHVLDGKVRVLITSEADAHIRRIRVEKFGEVEGATGLAIATGNLIDARDSEGFFRNFPPDKRRKWSNEKTYSSLLCVPVYDTLDWIPLGSVCIASVRRTPFWDKLKPTESRSLERTLRSTFRNLLGYQSVFK